MISRMQGHDFFYYKCSECGDDIVAIRKLDHPIQCSVFCRKMYIRRYLQEIEIITAIIVKERLNEPYVFKQRIT